MSRELARNEFLAQNGLCWGDFGFLAGDASNRKYYRTKPGASLHCLLMDAPPSKGEDIRPFVQMATHLRTISLAAPKVYAANPTDGFALLQDFGDTLFFDTFQTNPALELPYYTRALDVLDHLHTAPPPPGLAAFGPHEMADVAGLVCDWYAANTPRPDITTPLHDTLVRLDWSAPVLVLRDYHAQNLIWRDGHSGLGAVGLLDFQDAQIGHPYYDAMSLIDDARRDVSPPVRDALLTRVTGGDPAKLLGCNAISAQRNLRILGVFARLCIRDGKPHYIDLIPRVWANLQRNLSTPGLGPLARACAALPPPTPEYLNWLKTQCPAN